jgi:hypothetical protein
VLADEQHIADLVGCAARDQIVLQSERSVVVDAPAGDGDHR